MDFDKIVGFYLKLCFCIFVWIWLKWWIILIVWVIVNFVIEFGEYDGIFDIIKLYLFVNFKLYVLNLVLCCVICLIFSLFNCL